MKISSAIAVFVMLLVTYVQSCNKGSTSVYELCAGEKCITAAQCASNTCVGSDVLNGTAGLCSLEGYQWALIGIGSALFCAGIVCAGICCHRRRKLGRDLHSYGQIHH